MNAVFDLGNVLLAWDPRYLFRKLFDDEAEMEWFLAHVCTHEWNLENDRGRSFTDAVKEATARHPKYENQIAAYHQRWDETQPHAIAGTVAVLEDLRAKGTALYALTNWNGDTFRRTRPRYPFMDYFRDILVSGDEGLIKPDPAIYELLLARNRLIAAESLFIDDSIKNVRGAESVGMKGHRFISPEGLRAELTMIGVL